MPICKKKKYILSYDLIRIIGTILVVLGHSTYPEWSNDLGTISLNAKLISENFNVIRDTLQNIGEFAYLFHMPLFFALSGALYVMSDTQNILELFKKKGKRLLFPYFLTGLLWMFPIKYLVGFYPDGYSVCKGLLYFLTGKDAMGHLWFLPTLFICTLLFEVILKVSRYLSVQGGEIIALFISYLITHSAFWGNMVGGFGI